MNRIIFFLFFLVLAGSILWLYLYAGNPPEKGTTLTPKGYIERVEKKKAERLRRPPPAPAQEER